MEKEREKITTLSPASPNSNSLRTTVPMSIVKHLKLRNRDKLKWEIKPVSDRFAIMVEPLERRYWKGEE